MLRIEMPHRLLLAYYTLTLLRSERLCHTLIDSRLSSAALVYASIACTLINSLCADMMPPVFSYACFGAPLTFLTRSHVTPPVSPRV